MRETLRRRKRAVNTATLAAVVAVWVLLLLLLGQAGDTAMAQLVSNVGLVAIAFGAGCAALGRARKAQALRRFWLFLGLASLSWSVGQAIWTWYESVLGRDVPFPSLADIGYLGHAAAGGGRAAVSAACRPHARGARS